MFAPGTEVIAKFEFRKSSPMDLPFDKGDTLVVVGKTQDVNWIKVRNLRGMEGLIPVNYVEKKEKAAVQLHKMPWFHGRIDRAKAERLLTSSPEDGLFLVRESTNYPGDYALCVCYHAKVEHYHVMYDKKDQLTVDEESSFSNLTQLVNHYIKGADGLICRLKKPLEKQGTLAVSVDAESFMKSGWHIRRKDVDLIKVVGHGEFGDVWEGLFNQKKVAVKSLKEEGRAAQTFLTEASVMTALNHKNLVMLLGVSLDGSPIYIITEFCEKGSLVEYLRSRGRSVITQKDLIGFARDVANGMCYLESQNFIHRDLAARNVLLDENCMAKVADFGHAREQSVSVSGKLPVKWTAPEALKDGNFSSKSDVWSFSIFLWEMYSFGRVPYPRVQLTDVLSKVIKGYRMEKPDACTDDMFSLMTSCWQFYPNERPTFKNIVMTLKTYADDGKFLPVL
ncbi:tyrosine-protein kinase CSK-like [Xenia sp. Carnegie-2017]|uniref:tyrosine-protein kinase CSK-like n=1 Tax=Xenia sp. Carnegie-2017 TaxID=2897299 RepID=UPI001F03A665|nr:tyrosine-protein kinase CSK-like [Xenia sp. Carnegie-2017]